MIFILKIVTQNWMFVNGRFYRWTPLKDAKGKVIRNNWVNIFTSKEENVERTPKL